MKKYFRNKIKSLFKESLGFPPQPPLKDPYQEEKLKGGLADNKTLEDIATHHKVDIEHLMKQWDMGMDVEKEHTKSNLEADEIVKDHLWENPNYYTELAKMEKGQKLNEMPYFFLKDKQGNDLPNLDIQMEKWKTEQDFLEFLAHIFSGQPYQDEKQPLIQTDNPNEFYNALLNIDTQSPQNPATQLLILFTRKFVPGKEKTTLKTITPEDIQHYTKFIQTAVGKASERRS